MLPPLFQLAVERSSGGDVQVENRALILTLTLHALGMNPDRFFEVPQEMPVVPRLRLTLLGRHDLAQHYLVSAALAISGGSVLAAAIGEFKELDDSRRGTGFSFPDLLADRAGIRLAELATGSRQQARRLQQQLGAAQQETDFMPRIGDLPEGIMELEFKHRYRDLDSEAYRLVQDEIDRRRANAFGFAERKANLVTRAALDWLAQVGYTTLGGPEIGVAATKTLSSTVKYGKRWNSWKTKPMFWRRNRVRWCSFKAVNLWPLTEMSP